MLTTVRCTHFLRVFRSYAAPSHRFASRKTAQRLAAQRRSIQSKQLAAISRRVLSPVIYNSVVGPKQNFRYFLVMDFEATCDHKSNAPFGPSEIIEFPALKVCSSTYRVESTFHTFVRPTVNPILKPFCTQLTGVVQDDVDGAPTLLQTLKDFHEWMMVEGLSTGSADAGGRELDADTDDFAVVTCGDWDMGKGLSSECARLGVPMPPYLKSWVNIKLSFSNSHGKWPRGMQHMLDELKLPLHGRPHSGIDDCVNITNLLKAIAVQKQHVFNVTSTFKENADVVTKSFESFHF